MTSCEYYQELISRMLDDDLSKDERRALGDHVKTCPDCAAVYVAFRSLSEHLGTDLVEVPESVHENIMAEVKRDSIRSRNRIQRSHRNWHTVLTLAACLVLVVAASFSLPKIVGRKGAASPEPAAVPQVVQAEEPAAAPLPEPKETLQSNMGLGSVPRDVDSAAEDAPEEEAVGFAAAPLPPKYDVDGALILNEEQSITLLDCLSGVAQTLESPPDEEIHVVLQKDGEPRPLTILLTGEEVLYVRADGDCTCRVEMNREELLSLLGLSENDK